MNQAPQRTAIYRQKAANERQQESLGCVPGETVRIAYSAVAAHVTLISGGLRHENGTLGIWNLSSNASLIPASEKNIPCNYFKLRTFLSKQRDIAWRDPTFPKSQFRGFVLRYSYFTLTTAR